METNITKLQSDLKQHVATLKKDATNKGFPPVLGHALSALVGALNDVEGHIANTTQPETPAPAAAATPAAPGKK